MPLTLPSHTLQLLSISCSRALERLKWAASRHACAKSCCVFHSIRGRGGDLGNDVPMPGFPSGSNGVAILRRRKVPRWVEEMNARMIASAAGTNFALSDRCSYCSRGSGHGSCCAEMGVASEAKTEAAKSAVAGAVARPLLEVSLPASARSAMGSWASVPTALGASASFDASSTPAASGMHSECITSRCTAAASQWLPRAAPERQRTCSR